MVNGEDVVDEILGNKKLLGFADCTKIANGVKEAMYGNCPADSNRTLSPDQIPTALAWSGMDNQIGVIRLEFSRTLSDTSTGGLHYIAIVPWQDNAGEKKLAFTVLMANQAAGKIFSLNDYIEGQNNAAGIANGYRKDRSRLEIAAMLGKFLNNPTAWTEYFGLATVNGSVTTIQYSHTYPIKTKKAIENIKKYK